MMIPMEKLTDMIWNEEHPCNECDSFDCPFDDPIDCALYRAWLDDEDDLDE